MSASLKYLDSFSVESIPRPATSTRHICYGLAGISADLTSSDYKPESQTVPLVWSSHWGGLKSCEGLALTAAPIAAVQWNDFHYLPWPAPTPVSEEQRSIATMLKVAIRRTRVWADMDTRIEYLRTLAFQEKAQFSQRSRACLANFLGELPFDVVPKIFLQETGNLRAVWRKADEQVALEFMDNGGVRYVFFAARPKPLHVARSAGIDDLGHIFDLLKNMGLSHLLEDG